MMSHRFRRLIAFAGLSFAAGAGAQSGPGTAVDAVAVPPLALSARGMSLDAPATRIYRSVGSDGSVVYGGFGPYAVSQPGGLGQGGFGHGGQGHHGGGCCH